MYTYDVLAYVFDGSAYCTDCYSILDEEQDDQIGVVFAEDETNLIGTTCEKCFACYGPDGWSEPNCDPTQWRWTKCPNCNAQRPFSRDDCYARLDALQGNLMCNSCQKPTRF